jgi:hypothetical protein
MHVAPAAHARPHIPQCSALVFVLTSQPFAALMSQFAKPALQLSAHIPAAHVAVAFAAAAHATPHVPQLATLVLVLTSQPFAALMSQFAKPALHTSAHAPATHVGAIALGAARQTVLHAPQFITLVRVSTSHPFAGFMSQSAKPALQRTPHAPSAHVAVALGPAEQTRPHVPQLFTSVVASTHETIPPPLVQRMLGSGQSKRHIPEAHICPAGHAAPHAPQFIALDRVSASQPLVGSRSQSAKPAAHAPIPHVPIVHEAAAFIGAGQARPHAPQFITSVCTSKQLAPHMILGAGQSERHAPATHTCPAAQAAPHAPQFIGSDCVLVQRPPHDSWPDGQPPASLAASPIGVTPASPREASGRDSSGPTQPVSAATRAQKISVRMIVCTAGLPLEGCLAD